MNPPQPDRGLSPLPAACAAALLFALALAVRLAVSAFFLE